MEKFLGPYAYRRGVAEAMLSNYNFIWHKIILPSAVFSIPVRFQGGKGGDKG